jgi:hypothetical protein
LDELRASDENFLPEGFVKLVEPLVSGDPPSAQEAFVAPKRVAANFVNHPISWYVVGGWAVDLYLGRQTRHHEDIEVAVYRRDQRALRDVFEGWTWRKVVGGTRVLWNERDWLELPTHELHAEGPHGQVVEILLQESNASHWRFRRDLSISMPLAEAGLQSRFGIPILRPDVVLLYKAKCPRPRDEEDFRALRPHLSHEHLEWLASALERCHPGHPWRRHLEVRR